MFWEYKLTPVNMKNCGRRNVRKLREIKDGEKYITLYIYLDFGSLHKIKITSSETKEYLGILGKGLINSMGINAIRRPKKNKKAKYAITNVSLKDISKIINMFEKLPYCGYVQKRSKHESIDSYFYLSRQLAKCIMGPN